MQTSHAQLADDKTLRGKVGEHVLLQSPQECTALIDASRQLFEISVKIIGRPIKAESRAKVRDVELMHDIVGTIRRRCAA
jgi:hypothetical protein